MNSSKLRRVLKVFAPPIVPEGKGAKVMRVIGTRQLPDLNPFIMLDYFGGKLPVGFPDHPHRGFETVSYMLQGTFYHEDSKGHSGKITPGDIQWMTAGKGILHSEMPGSYNEESTGFQLWLNLQSKFKMCDPQYQEITKDKIPLVKGNGVEIKLIAGEALNQKGPIYTRTPAFYMDILVKANNIYEQNIPLKWNSLCFVYQGKAKFSDKEAGKNEIVLLDKNDTETLLRIEALGEDCKFILIAGEPINEPIVQHGPFVMNTQEEIEQTFKDYYEGKNGFEDAHKWQSKIRLFANGPQYAPKE